MKQLKLLQTCALSMFMMLTAHTATAQGSLTPEQCTIGTDGRPVCHPIIDIGFSFDGKITAKGGAKGYITCNGDTVAEKAITIDNGRRQGWAYMIFDEPLILPKGQDYTVTVPAGTLALESDPAVTNDELRSDFNIPASLPIAENSITDGSTVEKVALVTFFYKVETKALATNPLAMLYRNTNGHWIKARTYPVNVTYDWDLGQAYVDFGQEMRFEKGVEYRIVIPEGTISALRRDDIVNEEASITFTGGYTEPLPTVDFTWCNLFGMHDFSKIYDVKFYYDIPITATPGMLVSLCRPDDGEMIAGVEPTVSTEEGKWVLTAGFGGLDMSAYDGFTVVIPEGLVVSAEGDVVVNKRSATQIGGTTGITNSTGNATTVSCNGHKIIITNAPIGESISLITPNGQTVATKAAGGAEESMPLPGKGMFIVKVGGASYKILSR